VIGLARAVAIFACRAPVDMRKQYDSLAAIVIESRAKTLTTVPLSLRRPRPAPREGSLLRLAPASACWRSGLRKAIRGRRGQQMPRRHDDDDQ